MMALVPADAASAAPRIAYACVLALYSLAASRITVSWRLGLVCTALMAAPGVYIHFHGSLKKKKKKKKKKRTWVRPSALTRSADITPFLLGIDICKRSHA